MDSISYKTIGEVLKSFQITYREDKFTDEIKFNVSDYFRQDLNLAMKYGVVNCSDFAVCENLIYPVLKEVWKKYLDEFTLWNHHSLDYDENPSGFLEYTLAKRSPLGKVVFDQPYCISVQAKQDNFETSTAQCLAEMVDCQRLDRESKTVIYGIVSNGIIWKFSKLVDDIFIQDVTPYSIYDLDKLFAVVNFIFQQCQLQLKALINA